MGKDQSEARLETLYRLYAENVRDYLLTRGVPEADVEDLVIQTFTPCWRHLSELPDDPLPWLHRSAYGFLVNRRRGAARGERFWARAVEDCEARAAAIDGRLATTAEAVELLGLVVDLSPKDREALLLTYWDGLSSEEAAAVLGCTPAALRQRIRRSRMRLRAQQSPRPPAAKSSPTQCATKMSSCGIDESSS